MPDFIRTYTSNGRTYVYFRPPAAMVVRGGKARRLSNDVEVAPAEAQALVRAWQAKEKEPSRRYTWHGKMLALLRGARTRARARGRPFSLTLSELTRMLDRQRRRLVLASVNVALGESCTIFSPLQSKAAKNDDRFQPKLFR